MNPGSSNAGGLAFAPAPSETFFPAAGAALLILLLIGAAVLVYWARARRNAPWRAPWSAFQPGAGRTADIPRHLSSLRLDAAHRLHVVAWDNRQFLIATGVNVAPVVVATTAAEQGPHRPSETPMSG